LTFSALAAVAAPIVRLHAERLAGPANGYRQEGANMRRMVERLRKVHPRLPRGSSLLVVDDPLPEGYFLLFMAQLAYTDPSLRLNRIKMMSKPPTGDELISYDYVLGGGWELHDVRGIGDPRPPVDVRFVSGGHSVAIPEFGGKTVDLCIAVSAGDRWERSILRNVVLDSSGRAELPAPVPSGSIVRIEWVRPADGNWISASEGEKTGTFSHTLDIRRCSRSRAALSPPTNENPLSPRSGTAAAVALLFSPLSPAHSPSESFPPATFGWELLLYKPSVEGKRKMKSISQFGRFPKYVRDNRRRRCIDERRCANCRGNIDPAIREFGRS